MAPVSWSSLLVVGGGLMLCDWIKQIQIDTKLGKEYVLLLFLTLKVNELDVYSV